MLSNTKTMLIGLGALSALLVSGAAYHGSQAALGQAQAASRPAPMLPAGTSLPIRLTTRASSASSQPGDAVVAVVRDDVRASGRVLVPAGSELRGRVVAARRSGQVKGLAYLELRFDRLQVDGVDRPVALPPLAAQARPTHGRDAGILGGTTGAGALLGAALGGGRGAGRGALIGAAAGTGVVLTNRGDEVEFPAGGLYRLELARPLVMG
jgi:hypothetical protein